MKLFNFSKVSISCLKPIGPHISSGPDASSPRIDRSVREADDLAYLIQGLNTRARSLHVPSRRTEGHVYILQSTTPTQNARIMRYQ